MHSALFYSLALLLIIIIRVPVILGVAVGEDFILIRSDDCSNPTKTIECTELGKVQLGCCSTSWEDSTSYNCSAKESKERCIGTNTRECVPVTGYTKSHITAEFAEEDSVLKVTGVKKTVDFSTPVEECRAVDYEPPELVNMSIGIRSTLTLLPKALLGRRCSPTLYKYHKIKEMWEYYFKCPFDKFDINSEDSPFFPLYKIASLSYYYPKIFERVCLASGEILECRSATNQNTNPDTGYCDCLRSSISTNNFKIQQTSQGGKKCGQVEGFPCTHNITIAALTNNSCQIKTPVGQKRPEILNCEPDAGCSSMLEKNRLCPVNKICTCKCSEGHQCNAKSEGSRKLSSFSISHVLKLAIIILLMRILKLF